MLTILVRKMDLWDEESQVFIDNEDVVLELEHSLVSLSKWESKYKKPFLDDSSKTEEEMLFYIECMITTPNFPPDVFLRLTEDQFNEISDYIQDEMTATWFNDTKTAPKSREKVTSEIIYYWMNSLQIEKAYEEWHLNRLMTLIKVHNLKNAKPKKMSRSEMARRNRELNAKRKAELGTSG